MINKHYHQEVAVYGVCGIFNPGVMYLLILNLLMLDMLDNLNKGKQDSFPPHPLLARRSDEQIEEESRNEEIDSQLINNGHQNYNIKDYANIANGRILNYFIEQGNPKPDWYQEDQDEEYQDQEEEEYQDEEQQDQEEEQEAEQDNL
ncbi:MAG: hypothetical protein EZS28_014616 [Streblomastix strix]|uniref:Uncharacterized protein n=1 Tax=Streblomastix strix TaxID=222440 RepID=A0A5J4W582_9EUKA|nr:MAG: hypothetical protein EZS28_014616 [Streblomastix strix]